MPYVRHRASSWAKKPTLGLRIKVGTSGYLLIMYGLSIRNTLPYPYIVGTQGYEARTQLEMSGKQLYTQAVHSYSHISYQ